MRCLWCRRKIGVLRRLVDQEYCSALHRKLARAASARELRDAGYLPGEEGEFDALSEERKAKAAAGRPSFAGFALLFMLASLSLIWLHNQEGAAGGRIAESYAPPARGGGLWGAIQERLPSVTRTSVRHVEDFEKGLNDWNIAHTAAGSTSWTVRRGWVQPRELRLWAPSLKMTDYDLQFQAQIEQKAVGWAVRAKDLNNYYATKIVVARPAPYPVSQIVRYAMIGGKEHDRVTLPIPVQIQQGSTYRVWVRVKGQQLTTSVNGEVVDRWTDSRLKSGGVGFFADAGEVAAVMGVEVAEQRSILDRLFLPALLMPAFPAEP